MSKCGCCGSMCLAGGGECGDCGYENGAPARMQAANLALTRKDARIAELEAYKVCAEREAGYAVKRIANLEAQVEAYQDDLLAAGLGGGSW